METNPFIYDVDGVPVEAGVILEPSHSLFLEQGTEFLATAPLWRVELSEAEGWRIQPQRGGAYFTLTQTAASQCRIWPSPVTDICDPTGRLFPPDTPREHRFYAV